MPLMTIVVRTPAEDVKSLYLGVTQPPMIRVVLIALPSGGGRLLRGIGGGVARPLSD